MTGPVSHLHFQNWHPVTWIKKTVILREILGAVIWIVFNKSWHSIACCQRWPKGKSLLVHFLLNWKWQGMLKAFLLLFVTNENFTAKFLRWRALICVPITEKKCTEIEFTLYDFSITSRSFWVMITSSAGGSQSLLTKKFLQRWDEEQMFLLGVPRKLKCKNVKYRLEWCLQTLN